MNGKDKNFVFAIIITMMVLFLYPKIVMHFFPQAFPKKAPVISRERSVSPENNNIQVPYIAQNATEVTYSKEKSYFLSNQLFTIKINSPKGDIAQIALHDYVDPATGNPTIILNTQDQSEGVFALTGALSDATLENVMSGEDAIAFNYKTKEGIDIKKVISIFPDLYKVMMDIEIKNSTENDKVISYQIVVASGVDLETGIDSRYQEIVNILSTDKQQKKSPSKLKGEERFEGEIKITALKNRYFSLVMVPLSLANYTYTDKYVGEEGENKLLHGIGVENLSISSKSEVVANYVFYAGPNDSEAMSYLNLGVEDVRGSGFFAGFADFLLMLMRLLHNLLRNYGLAVIGLSLVINLFLYPLTYKSLKSMKEMQAIQPLVEELRNDLKDNPTKLNKEIMELYRKHKVNPLGGCLPMVFQIPVFFSLYAVLMQAVELRGASFLWIKDLSGPDAFITLSSPLPFIGNSLNLLPLIMAVLSFAQQKLTNPSQANEQQKMMAMFFPVFMGFIFYKFPSGLVLYFLTNTIFSIVMQTAVLSKVRVGEEK